MTNLLRGLPPEYDHYAAYSENFKKFFDWITGLSDPMTQVPAIASELGYGIRVHPLGFTAAYLSEPHPGVMAGRRAGLARVNIYPRGEAFREDIHSHGFNFVSGVTQGTLINTRHYPDFTARVPEGEGYIGYETVVDSQGINHTVQATDAIVSVPRSERFELGVGESYVLRPNIDFHSVSTGDEGAVTLFCKTPTFEGSDGLTLVLRKPDQEAPPSEY